MNKGKKGVVYLGLSSFIPLFITRDRSEWL